jgi:spore germination cell wall hydrolase CwlJ-like protein
MHHNETHSRSDRALFAALAIILATASAALGAAMTYRPAPPPVVRVTMVPRAEDSVLSQLIAEHRCLAEALYYEARGEGSVGQQAVAEVVFHRMKLGHYGHSICSVVYEGASHRGCQFSFTCNGDLRRPRETAAWEESETLAAQILDGEVRLGNQTGGATNYHAVSVKPYWAPELEKTARIGHHIFYRGTPRRASDA